MKLFEQLIISVLFLFSQFATSDLFEVTSANFDSFADYPAVLLEFYAPWCGHCNQFEGSYKMIEKTLSPLNIKVGRCDSAQNQALAARFNIAQIPSIFLIRGGSTWVYEGILAHDKIVDFAKNGYKSRPSLSILESPMGPFGRFKGLLIRAGMFLFALPGKVSNELGLSSLTALILSIISVLFVVLSIVFFIVYLTLPRQKVD